MTSLKELFPEHYDASFYDVTPHQRAAYLRWCTIALDASTLLSLYAFTEQTRREYLDILDALGDRIWLPHQAALEYEKNRLSRISAQIKASQEIRKTLRSVRGTLQEEAGKKVPKIAGERQHPFVDLRAIRCRIDDAVDRTHDELEQAETEYGLLLKDDPIRERLNEITRGRIGEGFSDEELDALYDEGLRRYERDQPPGYMDSRGRSSKSGVEKYGDLVLWRQLVLRGISTGRSVLLVTNDLKEDWWRDTENRKAGPRIELVNEMTRKASVRFLLLDSAGFFEWAQKHLERHASKAVIAEVRRASETPPLRYPGVMLPDFSRSLREMLSLPEIALVNSRIAEMYREMRDAAQPQFDAFRAALQELALQVQESVSVPFPWALYLSSVSGVDEDDDQPANAPDGADDLEDHLDPPGTDCDR